MCATNRIMVILVTLLLGLFSVQSFAQSDNANPAAFGIGKPVHILDLPDSAFRKNLLSLPPQARATALKWMQGFNFPAEDVKYLRASQFGGIYYADMFLPPEADSAEAETPVISEAIAEADVFFLHSRPGSDNVLYLDFDGHIITNTAWNNDPNYGTGIDPHPALPFDPSENDLPDPTIANFTSDELNRIGQIWHRMAEDYAPYDIDITTEEPAVFTSSTGRVLFTHDIDANGNEMPAIGAGGVAWVNVFGRDDYAQLSPAIVYYTNLYTNQHGDATLNAEAGSHEFGHNIALGHDGNSSTSYYPGHGTGFVRWGPIMGGSYQDHVTQWSKGEYPGANNTEDDLAIIAGDLGYIADDHSDTSTSSTELVVEANGDVLVSSPELDPHNDLPTNKGIINSRTDIDWFYIDVGAGPLTLVATPSWHSFTSLPYRGSNLDIEMTLYDSALTQLAIDDPTDDTFATVSLPSAAAGRYYVKIDGVGNANYSDYNSMGMFFIEGTVTPVSLDSTIPSPSPMTFASSPAATGAYSIAMTATTATDDSGYIEYQFACQAGGGGCTESAWQTSTSYTATGLDSNTMYSYVVRARDSSQNTTLDSGAASATTDSPPPNAPTSFTAAAVSQTQINLTWVDNSNDEDGFNLHRSTDQSTWEDLPNPAANATSFDDNNSGAGLASGTQYFYEIRSISNDNGASAWASANAITLEDAPDGTPTGLTATPASTSQIDLSWTNQGTNAASIKIERSADGTNGWSNIGSVSPTTVSFPDTGLVSGATWYYRVGAYTTGGTNYSDVVSATTDFECIANQPMTSGEWVFFSLPCMPANPSASTVFSAGPVAGNYGSRWWIYTYDNSIPDYVPLKEGDALVEGKGYLFYSLDAYTSAEIAGSFNVGNSILLSAGANPGIWNLVGNPYNNLAHWTSVNVHDGAKSYAWSEMDKKNGSQPYFCEKTPTVDAKCIMWHVMNKWEGNVYVPYDGQSESGALNAFDAMWVRAHRSITITMTEAAATPPASLEAASSSASESGTHASNDNKSKKNTDWSVRLVAQSGSYRDAGNRLGQAENAKDGLDSRDLEEWTPFGSPYLSILFTNPLFDDVDWGYTRDFRGLTRKQEGEWTFVVRASDEISEVTLKWQGDAVLFDNALLIDEISGETIMVTPGGSYSFDMDGNEHPFRIIFN